MRSCSWKPVPHHPWPSPRPPVGADEPASSRTRVSSRRALGGTSLAGHRPVVRAGGRHRRRRAKVLQVVPGVGPRCRGRRRRPMSAPLRRATCRSRPAVRRRGRPAHRAPTPRRHLGSSQCGLASLDIQVITAPTVRLDLDADRRNLAETVASLQPRLLILDPFVRLHRIDENASGEVAPLLAYLRELQRRHDVAVLVVHHAKKGCGGVRAGQALRGSSEFHAWGDSNLYLRRDGDDLSLSVEHRAAASMTPITIELAQRGTALALEVVDRRDPATPPPSSLDERITAILAGADAALPFAELRAGCRVRATTLYQRLAVLADSYRLTIKVACAARNGALRVRGSRTTCRGVSLTNVLVLEWDVLCYFLGG